MSLDWLVQILERKTPDGRLCYSDAEVRDLLAVVLISRGFRREELTPELEALLGGFSARAGVVPGSSKEETTLAFQRYLAVHPLNPALLREFEAGPTSGGAAHLIGDHLAGAFSKYLAAGPRRLLPPIGGERPEGTTAATPLARFTITVPGESKTTAPASASKKRRSTQRRK